MNKFSGFLGFNGLLDKDYIKNHANAMHNDTETNIYSDSDCSIAQNTDSFSDENFLICFLGDLYNFKELKKQWGCTNCNTVSQLISFIYNKTNTDLFCKLNGKFAIIIYDKKSKSLRIVCDKVASKKIYYYKSDNCFIFASNLNSLLSCEIIPKEIDKNGLSQYMQLTYIPTPCSIIKNVYKINAATYLTVDCNGNTEEKEYWNINSDKAECYNDYNFCKDTLKNLLYKSVEEKLSLYNKCGAFLSGGFDSSIVVGIMADLLKKPLDTFTVGFKEKRYDESDAAILVAEKNNTNHHTLVLDWEKVVLDIDKLLSEIDEPYADSSLVATYAIAKYANEFVDVAFMGDSGDELFAGYNKYLISYYSNRYKKIPAFLRKGIIKPLFKLIPSRSSLSRKIGKVISSDNMSLFEQRKYVMCLGFKAEELKKLMKDGFVDSMDFIKEQYDFLSHADEMTKAQYVDFKTVLSGDMLRKVEIAEKASGLKMCAPILDDEIINFAYSIPTEFKIKNKERKIILKDSFRNMLPKELFTLPKKGFAIPIADWLENNLKEQLYRYADKSFLYKQGLFNSEYIKEIIDEHMSKKKDRASELWTFYIFQNWYERNLSNDINI